MPNLLRVMKADIHRQQIGKGNSATSTGSATASATGAAGNGASGIAASLGLVNDNLRINCILYIYIYVRPNLRELGNVRCTLSRAQPRPQENTREHGHKHGICRTLIEEIAVAGRGEDIEGALAVCSRLAFVIMRTSTIAIRCLIATLADIETLPE